MDSSRRGAVSRWKATLLAFFNPRGTLPFSSAERHPVISARCLVPHSNRGPTVNVLSVDHGGRFQVEPDHLARCGAQVQLTFGPSRSAELAREIWTGGM